MVYNYIFDYINGLMQAFVKQKTQKKEDLLIAVKLARQKISTYYAEVPSTMGRILISANILNPFQKLRSCRQWGKEVVFNPEDKTSYNTQFQEVLLK